MKKIVFRMTAFMALMMMTLTSFAKTQDWGGRVIDEKGEPMPFVNVVLLSLPDSAFVQGGINIVEVNANFVYDHNKVAETANGCGKRFIGFCKCVGLV